MVLAHDRARRDVVEVGFALRRHGLRNKRLARSRRPKKQRAFPRIDNPAGEDLWVLQREVDSFEESFLLLLQADNIFEADR